MAKPDQSPAAARKKAGLVVIYASIGVLTLGYILLARGSMTAAPILILGSFVGMAAGIMMGEE